MFCEKFGVDLIETGCFCLGLLWSLNCVIETLGMPSVTVSVSANGW